MIMKYSRFENDLHSVDDSAERTLFVLSASPHRITFLFLYLSALFVVSSARILTYIFFKIRMIAQQPFSSHKCFLSYMERWYLLPT